MQATCYAFQGKNQRKMSVERKYSYVIDRIKKREYFYITLYKLFAVCELRQLRLIVENPATKPHYPLHTQNFIPYTFIDNNRTLRGDVFKKPTAYWFLNCQPTNGYTEQPSGKTLIINKCSSSKKAGMCSEERSMISPDYARNFICDFILGKKQNIGQLQLF